jgi:hypothetical protein
VEGTAQVQRVPTKEVAACWAGNDDGEVCVSNPGSMTMSCGRMGRDAFFSYTGAAASLPGESVFDLDMRQALVAVQGIDGGEPVLLTFYRTAGDFLTPIGELPSGRRGQRGRCCCRPPGAELPGAGDATSPQKRRGRRPTSSCAETAPRRLTPPRARIARRLGDVLGALQGVCRRFVDFLLLFSANAWNGGHDGTLNLGLGFTFGSNPRAGSGS